MGNLPGEAPNFRAEFSNAPAGQTTEGYPEVAT